jgi:hypothetical protein
MRLIADEGVIGVGVSVAPIAGRHATVRTGQPLLPVLEFYLGITR